MSLFLRLIYASRPSRFAHSRNDLDCQIDKSELTFWFENEQEVLEEAERQAEFVKQHAEKIHMAQERSGLTRDQAKKKLRKLLKKKRKITKLKRDIKDGTLLHDDIKDEQQIMLDSESGLEVELLTLEQCFVDLL